jgi:transcriptional regulator with XRE-family HTH domain
LSLLAQEFYDKRLAVGLSQAALASATGLSRPTISRIENAKQSRLSIADASRLAAALGLDLSIRVYPGPEPLRDAAHVQRLTSVLKHVRPPLTYATEVPLPNKPGSPFEQRAWDALISGSAKRTAMELEMRLRDAQALERRMLLKRRDDPVDSFVLLVADTNSNRQILKDNPALFPGLARLTVRELSRLLRAGLHPPSSLVFV